MSDVPFHQKLNVAKNVFQRVIRLTDKEYRKESLQKAKQLLINNKYPENLVEKLKSKFIHFQTNRNQRKENFDTSKIIKMPYIPVLSKKLERNLKSFGFNAVFENRFNNKKLFTKLKSTEPAENISNVVYQISCSDCNGLYIGQTKRYLKERIKSHVYDKKEQTALKKHMHESGHKFDFKNPKILVREGNTQARLFHEAIQIKKSFAPLNLKTDVQCLSAIYDPVLIGCT